MNRVPPRRPHLVERAADAARSALMAEMAIERQAHRPIIDVPVMLAEPLGFSTPTHAPVSEGEAPIARDRLEQAGLVGTGTEQEVIRNEIALVREQVLRAIEVVTAPLPGRVARMVLVTSARGGEGKSFTALNLAASIAEGAGRPAVLVDVDEVGASLTAQLDLGAAPGLEALRMADARDPAAFVLPTAVPGLSVLPRGQASQGQPATLATALQRLAARLPQHVIVLDAPACLETSTCGLLATTAGQVLMVVLAERTQRLEVEAALDIVDACPNIELLLNRVTLKVSDSFGGRGAHGDHVPSRAQG